MVFGRNSAEAITSLSRTLWRSRTAKASRISQTVKSRCAREWGGWGRLEYSTAWRCSIASTDPSLGGSTLKHEGRRQTDRRAAYAGSRLKLIDASGRSRLIRQPFSRNGENSPYGMLGGIVETSASFEARSAPRSYPTDPFLCPPCGACNLRSARVRHRRRPDELWTRSCRPAPRFERAD
jgi:hypothetical protein